MNQGRIWCVVNPTVGLPLFIGSVAVTSLIVHYSVLSNTTWFSNYWQGGKAKTAAVVDDSKQAVAANVSHDGAGFVITVKALPMAQADQSFVVSVAPDPAARPSEQVALK
jgi:light-harvesting protein B-800-850 alpha chain